MRSKFIYNHFKTGEIAEIYKVLLQFKNHMTLFKENHWLKACQKRTIYFQVLTGNSEITPENVIFHCLLAENGDRDLLYSKFCSRILRTDEM